MRNTPQGTLIPGHQPMALESPRAGLLFARTARRLAVAAILVGLSTLGSLRVHGRGRNL